MLEWVKSTVTDLRKRQKTAPKETVSPKETVPPKETARPKEHVRIHLKDRLARSAQKRAKALHDAERARLMKLSEKELLVETLLTLRNWEARYGKLVSRLEIMERNVEEVTEGILDLEFGITNLEIDPLHR